MVYGDAFVQESPGTRRRIPGYCRFGADLQRPITALDTVSFHGEVQCPLNAYLNIFLLVALYRIEKPLDFTTWGFQGLAPTPDCKPAPLSHCETSGTATVHFRGVYGVGVCLISGEGGDPLGHVTIEPACHARLYKMDVGSVTSLFWVRYSPAGL